MLALCGAMSAADERAEKNPQKHIWLMDTDRQAEQQYETAGDVVLKNASPYPKVVRRGYAGEEFFLKASKSVPRIGRRNNDARESPKRSVTANKVRTGATGDSYRTSNFTSPPPR